MASYSDLLRLDGQVALVTGAARGIGAEIATALSQCGATVWLAGRDAAALQARAETLARAQVAVCDVTDQDSVKAALMAVRKHSGRLDIVVNNAGILHQAMLATTSAESLDEMLQVNVAGTFHLTRLAARLMLPNKAGAILNVSSVMGVQGAAGYAGYSATKAAVIGLTKALAKELAPHGIRVNALAPGFIETDMTAGLTDTQRTDALAGIALGRAGTPEDVAKAALFLTAPLSAYITGQVLGVDGLMTV